MIRATRLSSLAAVARPLPALGALRFLSQTSHVQSAEAVADPVVEAVIDSEAGSPFKPMPKATTTATSHTFQTETRRILDIVANSLYSEREIFVRELVANASDAIEKLRHMQAARSADLDPEAVDLADMRISISVDKDAGTITIADQGVGMTHDELVANLGTIAASGSKKFIDTLESAESSAAKTNIIGQFGVGFYSCFMVSDHVEVFSRSALSGSKGYIWTSSGNGASYEIAEADNVAIGTTIVIHLKDADTKAKFADTWQVDKIIRKYSNFVGSPIFLNNEKINTIDALWTRDKASITAEEHKEFYRFIGHAWDDPQFNLHYTTDAPLSIRALLYIPSMHTEFTGMGRMQPGVSLYSRKVLIQPKSKQLLPEWLRFVRGVVDSEDVPLNISRELLQDSALIGRLRAVLTSRIIKWMNEESKRDSEKYNVFFKDFGIFFKEGICLEESRELKDSLANLLRYETSNDLSPTSLKSYVESLAESQKNIYYLVSPTRESALQSPYLDSFTAKNINVIFCHETVDEFVMSHLGEYMGKKIVNVEKASIEDVGKREGESKISASDSEELCKWMKNVLMDHVSEVTISERVMSAPCLITDHDSAVMRRLAQMTPGFQNMKMDHSYKLEINSDHPIVVGLTHLRQSNEPLARQVTEQIYDNALIGAGLLDDPKSMLKRLNSLLEKAVENGQAI